MQDFFSDNTPSVESERILYTPSTFARSSLLHLQEVGSLKAISAHTSSRKDLVSFLCFVVLDGCGELAYEGNTYSHQIYVQKSMICISQEKRFRRL